MPGYFLYKLLFFLSGSLPLGAAYGFAGFLSLVKYYTSPRDRGAVIGNLRKILPVSELPHINVYARTVFVNFGKYLMEFFRATPSKKAYLEKVLKIEGLEHVDRALKRGKGAIILSAHIGNWEMGGIFMALSGYPMVVVALPHRFSKVDAFFNSQRERLGVKVIASKGLAVRHIYNALKKNQLVALVGDRDFNNGGRRLDFLGASKIFPRGPAAFALRTGAAIIPGFVIRHKKDKLVLEFAEPIEGLESEEEIMSRYARVIEEKVRQYPAQWLLFREFWKE
jgi:lauroyl/myristoyl acyltransferase